MGLRAHRFANDPTLEACLAGTHRMQAGEPSHAAVREVQQALIDAGFGLPLFGPDGVGPGAMAALDTQFQGEGRPLPPAALGPGELAVETYLDAVREAGVGHPVRRGSIY